MGAAIQYVYFISFSNFDTSVFGDYYIQISWVFFILATLILQIVLINLLISIVADTFSTIKSNYHLIMYKDLLHMIIENRYLALGPLTKGLNHKHLFMALPMNAQSDNGGQETSKPVIFRNDNQKVMMSMLESIENTMRN